jgi:threonine dehydrogenase-like Zn-dependent dehydrogenase
MIGTFRFYREYTDAVGTLVDGRIDVAPMLTHQFAFSDVIEAFAVAADRRRSMKVTLKPE